MILSIGGLSSAAVAQTSTARSDYTLTSGSEVKWTGPWSLDEQGSGYSQEAAGDVVTLIDGTTRFTLTTYPGIVSVADGRDASSAQYERTRRDVVEVDSGETASTAYGSRIFTDEQGDRWGSYSAWILSADNQTAISMELVAPVADIESAVGDAQSSITVAGNAILANVDPSAVAKSMSAAQQNGSSTGKNDTKTTSKAKTPTPAKSGASGSLDPVFVKAGLVTETTYESPQFGYSIGWDLPWALNPGDNEAVISNTTDGSDSLYIATDAPAYSLLAITGIVANGTTPADAAKRWASQDFLDEYTGQGTKVVLQDSNRTGAAVVTYGSLRSNENTTIITVREAVSLDGGKTLVLMTLIVPVDNFADIYASAQRDVTLGRQAALGFFTTDEIVSALP